MKFANVLQLSPLTSNHGLHTRAQMIKKALELCDLNVSYCDIGGLGLGKIVFGFLQQICLVLFGSYELCFIHKALPQNILLFFLAKARRKKVILDWDDNEQGFHKSKLTKMIFRMSEKIFVWSKVVVTTHSGEISNYLQTEHSLDNIYKLDQTIDESFFSVVNIEERLGLRESLGLSNERLGIYVGSFTKGAVADFDKVLDTFLFLRGKGYLNKLMIIGAGPLEKRLKEDVKKSEFENDVLWLGHINNNELYAYIDIADIALVYMRDSEANKCRVSLKLIEYLAREKLVYGRIIGESKKLFGDFVYSIDDLKRAAPDTELIKETLLACRVSNLQTILRDLLQQI